AQTFCNCTLSTDHHHRILRYTPTSVFVFFLFNVTPSTQIYTLSLHDALPIWYLRKTPVPDTRLDPRVHGHQFRGQNQATELMTEDRKSTRLNSSHVSISYAVFCLKKKNHCKSGIASSRITISTATHRAALHRTGFRAIAPYIY